MEAEALKLATERVLRVEWSKLPLSSTDVLADCSARLWWERHPDEPDEFYRTSLAYACHQIDRASGSQEGHTPLLKYLRERGANSVLDYGCGCGQVGFHFLEHGFDAEFADLDTPAFRIAKLYGWLNHIPASRFHELPASFPTRPYDAVLLFDVLEHVKHPASLMQRLRQISKQIAAIPTFGSSIDPDGTRMRPEHLIENDRYWGNWDAMLRLETGIALVDHLDTGVRIYA